MQPIYKKLGRRAENKKKPPETCPAASWWREPSSGRKMPAAAGL
jgi:hypothetical protein